MLLRASYASLGVKKPRFRPGSYRRVELLGLGLGLCDVIFPALGFLGGEGCTLAGRSDDQRKYGVTYCVS